MIRNEGGVMWLEGELTMATVGGHVAPGRDTIAAGVSIIDCSRLAAADSAALALFLDWLRFARQSGRRIVLRALPPGLASLAELYGMEGLLPVEAAA